MGQAVADPPPTVQGPSSNATRNAKSRVASTISGSLSGAIVSACVQPLDVIRTRMQAEATRGLFMSTAQTSKILWQEGKIAAFWRGTQPTIIRIAWGAGLNFMFLDALKPLFQTRGKDGSIQMSAFGAAMTGGLARAMAVVASCPVTVIKTRMEYGGVGAVKYKNTLDGLSYVMKTEGVRGLYRGLGPTVLSHAPFSALYYVVYTKMQSNLTKDGDKPTMAVNFFSGSVAAVIATLATQPADVLRTRMQLGLPGAVGTVAAQTSMQMARQIAGAQGTKGFMVGSAPRIVKRTLQAALVWTLYEELVPRITKAKEWATERITT